LLCGRNSVAGGHSIHTPESIYGLAVNGLRASSELRRNCDAKPKDILIVTKPVGVGLRRLKRTHGDYRDMIATMTRVNRLGAELAKNPDVHAMTDVTEFGILGHGLEMARGSVLKLTGEGAAELVREGFVTGASGS
jgi:selenide,water dikinase